MSYRGTNGSAFVSVLKKALGAIFLIVGIGLSLNSFVVKYFYNVIMMNRSHKKCNKTSLKIMKNSSEYNVKRKDNKQYKKYLSIRRINTQPSNKLNYKHCNNCGYYSDHYYKKKIKSLNISLMHGYYI